MFKMDSKMNMKLKYYAQIGLTAAAVAISGASCNDVWDEHYSVNSLVAGGELWDALNASEDLKPFCKVLDSCGYKKVLTSGQSFSVWAPKITNAEADQCIAAYKTAKANNIIDDENPAIHEFIRNHIALFNNQMSSLTDDTLRMMNGKLMRFGDGYLLDRIDRTPEDGIRIEGQPVHCADGVLYKLQGQTSFFPNIWERVQADSIDGDNALDSLSDFIDYYERVEIDEELSVPGGVVDGQTVYLDEVFKYSNDILDANKQINTEDSLFWFLAPTNKVWKEKMAEYSKYFEYVDGRMEAGDSLQKIYSGLMLINSSVFNVRNQPSRNFNVENPDSICSTSYIKSLPGYYVYDKPFQSGGILAGLQMQECSNGRLYKSGDSWRIDPRTTLFMREIELEAETADYYTTVPIDESATNEQKNYNSALVMDRQNDAFSLSNNKCLVVSNTSTNQRTYTEVSFLIPNTLSNCPYDIQVVFASPLAYDSLMKDDAKIKRAFTAMLNYYPSTSSTAMKPAPDVLNGGNLFEVDAEKMDTITVTGTTPFTFPACNYGYGEDEAKVKLTLQTPIKRDLSRNGYSGVLVIDKVILVPRPDYVSDSDN